MFQVTLVYLTVALSEYAKKRVIGSADGIWEDYWAKCFEYLRKKGRKMAIFYGICCILRPVRVTIDFNEFVVAVFDIDRLYGSLFPIWWEKQLFLPIKVVILDDSD